MYSYVARQPIVDRNKKIVAFELLYRNGKKNAFPDVNSDFATKSILINQSLVHQQRILNDCMGFVNFGYESLIDRLPFDFPNKSYTIEILETCPPSDELYDIVVELNKKGYRIALDDYIPSEEWLRFYDYIDIIKFDITTYPLSKAAEYIDNLKDYNIKFLAERVETYEEFIEAKEYGFHFFQGYFFSKPEVIHNKVVDSSLSSQIQLSAAISRETLDIEKIERIIASNPGLSFKLLNFVNECSKVKAPINSLQQALVYLGEDKIRKFVTYAVLKTLSPEKPSILFNMSLQRAKFFEMILSFIGLDKKKELGYLCGMLTVIDALLDVDISSILEPLNVDMEIKSALLNEEGILGGVIQLAKAVENSDWHKVDELSNSLKIKEVNIMDAFVESAVWADEVSV